MKICHNIYIDFLMLMWYCMCDEEIEKQRSKTKMNKKTAESLVGVHTHTHIFINK